MCPLRIQEKKRKRKKKTFYRESLPERKKKEDEKEKVMFCQEPHLQIPIPVIKPPTTLGSRWKENKERTPLVAIWGPGKPATEDNLHPALGLGDQFWRTALYFKTKQKPPWKRAKCFICRHQAGFLGSKTS